MIVAIVFGVQSGRDATKAGNALQAIAEPQNRQAIDHMSAEARSVSVEGAVVSGRQSLAVRNGHTQPRRFTV